jgi:predicted nuclease of restriction endonuclease-like (RecB) superfamily
MKKSRDSNLTLSTDYRQFVTDLKSRIASARLSAARRVNSELVTLYWDIGRGIVEKQQALGWGESVVEMVASELRAAFPDMSGFSARNVWDMKRLYEAYSAPDFLSQLVREMAKPASRLLLPQAVAGVQGASTIRRQTVAKIEKADPAKVLPQLVAEIPWGHHRFLLDKVTAPAARLWYLRATASFGWSRNVLLNQIKAAAYERAVTEKKTHNFDLALPEHFAEQAEEMLKSSYNLEFLGLRRAVRERQLEDRLISRLQAFLLELGYGFCFVGRQHRLVLGKKEYFIDLLFYHRFLKALVAFELKLGPFEPEPNGVRQTAAGGPKGERGGAHQFAGKMDFYLNLLNDTERAPGDQPSIGIILCAEKDDVEVEYALRTKANPIGVAAYTLQSKLPGELKGRLPTAKQLADMIRLEMEGGK